MKPSIAVIGATASGKSEFARHLAGSLKSAVIINADSMQLYRQCRTLTAQPEPKQRQSPPHKLYSVLDLEDPSSANRWGKMARRQIAAARSRGAFPILVGGSGFYLQSLLYGLSAIPQPSAAGRQRARNTAEGGRGWQRLKRLDPQAAAQIPSTDSQRIARALEVVEATGSPLSFWQGKLSRKLEGRTIVIMLNPPRKSLERATLRRLKRVATKAAAEVKQLLPRLNGNGESPLIKACGVREFVAHARGLKTLAAATEETFLSTCAYIRRQLTWFRHQPPKPDLVIRRGDKLAAKRTARLILAGRI